MPTIIFFSLGHITSINSDSTMSTLLIDRSSRCLNSRSFETDLPHLQFYFVYLYEETFNPQYRLNENTRSARSQKFQ